MANTQDISRNLKADGEMDYDHVNDILFFKVKNREYDFSLEFQNIVIDIDEAKFIVGIQIFNTSEFLRMDKAVLKQISNWQFKAMLNDKEIRLELRYQTIIRNKVVNNNIYPIIIQQGNMGLRNPQTVIAA